MLTVSGEQQMGTMCANILASSMLPSCSRSSYTTDAAGMTLERLPLVFVSMAGACICCHNFRLMG